MVRLTGCLWDVIGIAQRGGRAERLMGGVSSMSLVEEMDDSMVGKMDDLWAANLVYKMDDLKVRTTDDLSAVSLVYTRGDLKVRMTDEL